MRTSLAEHKRAFRKTANASSSSEIRESASSKAPYRQARKSGVLTLPAKGLTTFPDEALHLMDFLQPDEKGWECVDLIKVDLSHNDIAAIPPDIQGLSGLLSFKMCQNKLVDVPVELFSLTSLAYLDLSNNCLGGAFPDPLGRLNNLKELVLSGNKLTSVPASIGDLSKLEVLRLEDNLLVGFPDTIGGLQKLQTLTAQNNEIEGIPPSFKDLRHIATLDLSKNKLTSLIGCLKHNERLKFLDLRQNRLATFPELPFECTLDTLFLGFNSLTSINGASLVRAKDHLTVLDLRDNKLPLLPDDVCQLHRLKTLDVSNNDLSDLPPGLGYLTHLHHILTDGNSMRAIRRTVLTSGCEPLKKYLRTRGKPPSGVNALDEEFDEFNKEPTATDVEVGYLLRDASASGTLDLSDKKFSKVPLEFWPRDSMVDKLQVLDLAKNGLALIPFDIGLCVNLHTLVLDDNLLETLPSSIASLGLLHTLRLRKNNLAEAAFDHVLSQGTPLSCRVKELDVRNNALRFVPSGVVHLTSLQTLLLSYNAIAQLENIDWSRLQSLYVLSISDNKVRNSYCFLHSNSS
ncbi:hypothetical protein, variant 2 [Aphanomyces astaci]|uniref:Uncharacterized protein n=1 Tax=Aphanomyces astaci TaxID=112090 RepID=W4GQL9_APHAT|nr:hypothetical protein, variant 2 [Aphanomyces astaci]ETV81616.1 hypothetical protein, variant 2 [Aphanomyces astaci]|eukprot:XP_009829474.1 hypothetical protein, variant 2 [Aphanomyces astaci]